jgi:isoaspartyl peptidase/L-asparaginase-like protein (Ntn-hydrolase superfamily)
MRAVSAVIDVLEQPAFLDLGVGSALRRRAAHESVASAFRYASASAAAVASVHDGRHGCMLRLNLNVSAGAVPTGVATR